MEKFTHKRFKRLQNLSNDRLHAAIVRDELWVTVISTLALLAGAVLVPASYTAFTAKKELLIGEYEFKKQRVTEFQTNYYAFLARYNVFAFDYHNRCELDGYALLYRESYKAYNELQPPSVAIGQLATAFPDDAELQSHLNDLRNKTDALLAFDMGNSTYDEFYQLSASINPFYDAASRRASALLREERKNLYTSMEKWVVF